jgi:diacylglycerol kinase family enzyme
MRRLTLVANPSSSGFTGSLFRDVVKILGDVFEVDALWPVDPADARRSAADAAAAGREAVVAMGGDGVVHHVANGLVGTKTALGVVPAGTTNVFARLIGSPRNARKAALGLVTATTRPIGVIRIESDSTAGSRLEYATFAVGAGFDADVIEVAEQRPESKLWFGSLHFARAAVGRVLGPYRGKEPDLRVTVEGESADAVAFFAQAHEHYTFFGRIPMSLTGGPATGPAAAAITRLDAPTAARILTRLATRRALSRLDTVTVWPHFSSATISAPAPIPFQADGEHLGDATRIEFAAGGEHRLRVLGG